jgi:hypothetical protein
MKEQISRLGAYGVLLQDSNILFGMNSLKMIG